MNLINRSLWQFTGAQFYYASRNLLNQNSGNVDLYIIHLHNCTQMSLYTNVSLRIEIMMYVCINIQCISLRFFPICCFLAFLVNQRGAKNDFDYTEFTRKQFPFTFFRQSGSLGHGSWGNQPVTKYSVRVKFGPAEPFLYQAKYFRHF